jgi:hypothetical protein
VTTLDMDYYQKNLHTAHQLLIFLEDKRLLTGRFGREDEEYCRRSAHTLRGVLEGQMLTVQGGGMLLTALRDMRRACTTFVTAAGPKAKVFEKDNELFRQHLMILRTVFAQRVGLIAEEFELETSDEIRQIIDFVG